MRSTSLDEIVHDLRRGKMVIVLDSNQRENEGDLVMSAQFVTAQEINFMISHGRGLVCVPLSQETAERLQLSPMCSNNMDPHRTNFTVSTDHIAVTTGISAPERAVTIRALADPASGPESFRKPGHVFPLITHPQGLSGRQGHTEAALELMHLAGLFPVAVICEIIKRDGTMARFPDLLSFSRQWKIKIITVSDILNHLEQSINKVRRIIRTDLPTRYGRFQLYAYSEPGKLEPHLVLVKGNPAQIKEAVPVRIHSECITGDLFGSARCDCGDQLEKALSIIGVSRAGILIYLRQEGRNIGLLNKLKAYQLQLAGLDTVEANLRLGFDPDPRDFRVAAEILQDLKVDKIRLLTNNPRKLQHLEKYGITITAREALEIEPNIFNRKYLQTKKNKMGHLLNIKEEGK